MIIKEKQLQEYINNQLTMIAKDLPEAVKEPSSFQCGYLAGKKHILSDIDSRFCSKFVFMDKIESF